MKKRIVFMGTPEFACIVLKGLIESGEIELLALFCQPDRPFGRKKELKAPETKSYVENLGKNIRKDELSRRTRNLCGGTVRLIYLSN